MKIQYSNQIDAIIYVMCIEWDSEQFLDLAFAALDQYVRPDDYQALAMIEQLEDKLREEQ